MFERILVALDVSENNRRIFETALSLAKLTNGRLMLAHILSAEEMNQMNPVELDKRTGVNPNFPSHEMFFSSGKRQPHDLQHMDMLHRFHAIATAAGVGADLAQPLDKPGDRICNLAIDWGADLIVMGRRGLNEFNCFPECSVSDHVVHYASCPILVIQHHPGDPGILFSSQTTAMH